MRSSDGEPWRSADLTQSSRRPGGCTCYRGSSDPEKPATNCKRPQVPGHLVLSWCQTYSLISESVWFLSIPACAVCTQFLVYRDFSHTHICFPLESVLFPRPTRIPEHGSLGCQVPSLSLGHSPLLIKPRRKLPL